MQIAGKVVPLTKGDYDATITYNHLDWVRHDGATWCCKKDNIVGVEPTEGETWTLIAKDGENGQDGDKGDVGEGLTATSSKVGKITTVTLKAATSGTVVDTFTVLDGADGNGSGNMHTDTYDPTQSGIVNSARVLSNGTDVINMTDVLKKPISATDGQFIKYNGTNWVAGDGASDWNSVQSKPFKTVGDGLKVESEELKADVSWTNVKSKPFATVGTDFKTDSDTLALADTITKRLATIDENITDGFLKGNLWDEVWEVGGINNSTGINETDTENIRSVNYISIKPSNKYYIVGSVNIRYYFYDDSKSFISGGIAQNSAITSPSNAKYLRIRTTSSYGDKYKNDVSVFEGETPRSYIPYAKSNVELTRAIDDFDASMKMLGWTLPTELQGMNYIDANGVFHQKIDRVDMGALTYNKDSNYFFTRDINTDYSVRGASRIWCAMYTNAGNISIASMPNMTYTLHDTLKCVYFYNTSCTSKTKEEFRSAMSGVYLYYELATEVTKSVDGNEYLTSTLDNLTEEIALHETSITISNKSAKALLYRQGNIVFFTSSGDATSITQGSSIVGQIPNGYKPTGTVMMSVNNNLNCGRAIVDDRGVLVFYGNSTISTATNSAYSGTWITKDTI